MDFQLNRRRLPFPNNIQVDSQHNIISGLVVSWDRMKNPDIDSPVAEIIEIKYNVYRGTSVGGIFYKLNSQSLSENKYEDKGVKLHPNTQYFYKISTVAVFTDGNFSESVLSPPVAFVVPTTNKWFKKMNERNMWILKNTGVLMDLYRRKTEGERCQICYDDIRGQSGDNSCTNCFGTGFDGGFEPMHQLYVRQKPATEQLDLSPRGYTQNSQPGAWTISKVHIKNRDLLINPYGQVFSVLSSNLSHAAGFFLHQELTMKEIDVNDIRYHIKRTSLHPEI